MFTGIIAGAGKIVAITNLPQAKQFKIFSKNISKNELSLGSSISINGVCLTAIEIRDDSLVVDVSQETLNCTNLGALQENDIINFETAMGTTSKFDGHIVSGHVDATGEILTKEFDGTCWQFCINAPTNLMPYIAKKGSVCIDGISLTVNEVSDTDFAVNIIPHTMKITNIKNWQPNTKVNLEIDVVARYVARLLQFKK
ncbi:MAG: riboflavin synthase [Legionellales bacterium]|nr:MAG: riboflavin synthase [Legionellales bacterium]